jgi:hypothetical protein
MKNQLTMTKAMITVCLKVALPKLPTFVKLETFVVFDSLVQLGLKLSMLQRRTVKLFCGDSLTSLIIVATN